MYTGELARALARQADTARTVATNQSCPHCMAPLDELTILSLLHGFGTERYVRIRLPGPGENLWVIPAAGFNPLTMLLDAPAVS